MHEADVTADREHDGANAADAPATPENARILLLGNSQIGYARLDEILTRVARTTLPARAWQIEAFAVGGANLKDLWNGRSETPGQTARARIASGSFDVVVIQESIDLVEFRPPYPAQFSDYATRFIDLTRANGARPILFSTGYIQDLSVYPRGFEMMFEPQQALAQQTHVSLAAGGNAWQTVLRAMPNTALFARDRQHPGYKGSYLAALNLFAAISGECANGSAPEVLWCPPEENCVVSESERVLFQRAACETHRTVNVP